MAVPDVVLCRVINELAIACAYFMQVDQAHVAPLSPLKVCEHLLAGYHGVFPLQQKEVGAFWQY